MSYDGSVASFCPNPLISLLQPACKKSQLHIHLKTYFNIPLFYINLWFSAFSF